MILGGGHESRPNLLEVESMRDVVCCEEGGNQVSDGASLSTVRTELKGVQPPLSAEINNDAFN